MIFTLLLICIVLHMVLGVTGAPRPLIIGVVVAAAVLLTVWVCLGRVVVVESRPAQSGGTVVVR